nr:PmoA family protein [Micromonospora sp. DSM 115978]
MGEDLTGTRLRVRGETVAEYVVEPDIDPRWSPRPYLHPVRTLAGQPVTDTLPEDHRWHLGVSVAMQDVAGNNLWGGRTYVRDAGYTWRDDHGRIVHDDWGRRADDGFTERLRWLDRAGATLLTEDRTVSAEEVPGHPDAWRLDVAYALTAPADREIVLGSPATNGRPGGAGYGGFFWRAAPVPAYAFSSGAEGEEEVNGTTEPWVALVGQPPGARPYTLVFSGLADGDHWFVRTGIYPGVCVALAFEHTLTIPAGQAVRRRHRVAIADGALDRATAANLA